MPPSSVLVPFSVLVQLFARMRVSVAPSPWVTVRRLVVEPWSLLVLLSATAHLSVTVLSFGKVLISPAAFRCATSSALRPARPLVTITLTRSQLLRSQRWLRGPLPWKSLVSSVHPNLPSRA